MNRIRTGRDVGREKRTVRKGMSERKDGTKCLTSLAQLDMAVPV